MTKPPASEQRCGACYRCLDQPELGFANPTMQRMIVCQYCGNKRCPCATWHDNECTRSNDLGQQGSRYAAPAPPEQPARAFETGYGDPDDYRRQGWRTVSHEGAMTSPETFDVLYVDRDQAGPSLWMIRRREQPARGDGGRRVFEGIARVYDKQYGPSHIAIDRGDGKESSDFDWFGYPEKKVDGKRVRLTVEVLDDAPGKDGAR